jgi:small subunit ribosomal protein S4
MARYIGPVCRVCRRIGEKVFLKGERCLSPKCGVERRSSTPGPHKAGPRRRKVSERGLQLREKQHARFYYGMMEKQFRKFYALAEEAPGITGDSLKVLLERRLDNVVCRIGFARSHAQARQLVRHGHLSLNGHRMDIPSYLVKEGDVIAWHENRKGPPFKQAAEDVKDKGVPVWLSLDSETMKCSVSRLPAVEDIEDIVDRKAITAFYSR